MKLLYILIIAFVLIVILKNKIETFSGGALTQLVAKGPQDRYMISNSDKYLWWYYYPFYHSYYPETVWNNPTRVRRGFYDYRNYYPLHPYNNFPYYLYYM